MLASACGRYTRHRWTRLPRPRAKQGPPQSPGAECVAIARNTSPHRPFESSARVATPCQVSRSLAARLRAISAGCLDRARACPHRVRLPSRRWMALGRQNCPNRLDQRPFQLLSAHRGAVFPGHILPFTAISYGGECPPVPHHCPVFGRPSPTGPLRRPEPYLPVGSRAGAPCGCAHGE